MAGDVSAKISRLEASENVLHKQIYRGDIVISGPTTGLADLLTPILSVFSFQNTNKRNILKPLPLN